MSMEPLRRVASQASSIATLINKKKARIVKKMNNFQTGTLGRNDDIIIAVMGPTGVGKSNFIEKLTGNTETETTSIAGRGLSSHTSEIDTIRIYGHPIFGSRIVLVDTPGFDDTYRSDMEILTMISDWLKLRYESGVLLSGLIYLHRISDNRMSGSPARNLRMFGKLCGDAAADRVAFITTMWDRATGDLDKMAVYEKRQLQLIKYWEPMMNFGAQIGRFSNTTDSAWDAVSLLLKVSRLPDDHPCLTQTSSLPATPTPGSPDDDDDARSVFSHMSMATSVVSRKVQGMITSIPAFFQFKAEYSEPEILVTEERARITQPRATVDAADIYSSSSAILYVQPMHQLRPLLIEHIRSGYPKNSPSSHSEPSSPTYLGSPGELWANMDRLLTAGDRSTLFNIHPLSLPTPITTFCPPQASFTKRVAISLPHVKAHEGHSTIIFPTNPDVDEPTSSVSSGSVYSTDTQNIVVSNPSTTLVSPDGMLEDSDLRLTIADDPETGFLVIDAPKTVLHLQSELVKEHKKVHETDAAQTLYSALQTLIHENRKNMKDILKEKNEKMDEKTRARLEQDIRLLEGQFQKTFKEMKRLEMPPLRRVFLKVCPSALRSRTRALEMGF